MNVAHPIDLATWPRREHFEHYRKRVPCTYAITVDVDVTDMVAALRDSGRKTYIAQVWALASIVNRHAEFRMTITDDGEPAVWDVLHPAFTVFNPERETFACVWSAFDSDFARFHDAAAPLLEMHRSATSFFPKGICPRTPSMCRVSRGRSSPASRCRSTAGGTTCCRYSRLAVISSATVARSCRWPSRCIMPPPMDSTPRA